MSEEIKPSKGRRLKEGVNLKTQPAVVPKRRKLKTKTSRTPIAAMMPKGVTKWNIIFASLFGIVLILTIVNSYFYTMITIPLPEIILQFLEPAIMIIEVFIVLLAFEAKAFKFPKIHTRNSVKRIMITGFIIGALLVSFFTPYANLIGKYRDLPPGTIEPMDVDDDWFNSLFTGTAPFYIDGLLDLLDALDLNESLDNVDIARITATNGSLGDYLYRWEIRDTYQSGTWEFVESSPSTRYEIPSEYNRDPPDSNFVEYKVNQTVYSVTTGLLMNMISTWSNNHDKPYLGEDNYYVPDDWDDNIRDENNNTGAEDGTTNIRYNLRDMLSVQATTSMMGFVGSLEYDSYFLPDGNISDIVTSTGDFGDSEFLSSDFNTTYSRFLQKPSNYETLSPNVADYARGQALLGLVNGHDYYQQITYILESILEFGLPSEAESDNEGQDRAELVVLGSDTSLSGYLTLAVMTLRLNNIPCRPVFGFALGDEILGDSNDRMLKLQNFYAWIEALVPVDIGGGEYRYRWGQFQMGPYVDGSDYVYCDNTLYSSYDLNLTICNDPDIGFVPKTTVGSENVYMVDYGTDYLFRAIVTDSSVQPVEGATVTFKTLTLQDYNNYFTNPIELFARARDVGTAATNSSGYAELSTDLNPVYYPMYVPNDNSTVFALIAYVTFSSMEATGFIVVPDGYLTEVNINANKQLMVNPYPPPVAIADFYILQKGVNYTISTILYEEMAHITPLSNRLVTYYILDDPQMQSIIANPANIFTVTPHGEKSVLTNITGGSAVATLSAGFDFFENCSVSTTYYIIARYGQNYTVTILVYEDSKKSTIDISDDFHNKETEGDTFTTDLDFYLYLDPSGGTPGPITNEPINIWFVPQDVYDDATKTDRTAFEAYLTADPFALFLQSSLTDGSGMFNDTLVIDLSGSYPEIYYLIIFYLDSWNLSAEIIIADVPYFVDFNMNGAETVLPIETTNDFELLARPSFERFFSITLKLDVILCGVYG